MQDKDVTDACETIGDCIPLLTFLQRIKNATEKSILALNFIPFAH